MKLALLGFLAGLAVVGLMGCEAKPATRYLQGNASGGEIALLDQRLTTRLQESELHLSERLERIEANQTALMLRFGFRPEGGKP